MSETTAGEVERLGIRLTHLEKRVYEIDQRLTNIEGHIFNPREDNDTIHDIIDDLDSRLRDVEDNLKYGPGEDSLEEDEDGD
jgi:hypothetical protein